MMKTEITELTFDQHVNLQTSLITSLRLSWKTRSGFYSRQRVRENIELLRFLRTHSVMGRKYSFAS